MRYCFTLWEVRKLPSKLSKFAQRYGLPIGLAVLVLLIKLFYNDVPLFSPLNLKNILWETVSISLTALGLSYIMMSGEGDLSFAGTFSLLTVIFAIVSNTYNNFFVSYGNCGRCLPDHIPVSYPLKVLLIYCFYCGDVHGKWRRESLTPTNHTNQ